MKTYYAYLTPKGKLLPSTIRAKSGDAFAALIKTDSKYRHQDYSRTCRLVKVSVCVPKLDQPTKLRRL